jgi:DNA (cytosine-5)-methyltransferase 1
MIDFGSTASGIEAATVAWAPLGWKTAWVSEIDAAPSALLRHHYPDVPNHGDMRELPHLIRDGFVHAPAVFCAGTPCQAFSIAGLRNSLEDDRGNLTLTYCEIADEIDKRRIATGLLPAVHVWENVPGVLSTADNAFGCFLGALAGEDCPVVPPGKKWSNAGCVFGPQRAVAWRILDAQYFGLAQRRRRVFVVASARDGFDPAAVLFEFEGVRRDSPPSRGQGQEAAAGTLRRTDGGSDVDHARAGHLQPVECFGGGRTGGSVDVAACLTARGMRIDFEVETFAVQPVALFDERNVTSPENRAACRADGAVPTLHTKPMAVCITGDITHTLKAEGFDASEDGTGRGQPIVTAHAIQAGALRTNPNSGPDGVGVQEEVAYTLEARAEVQCAQHGMAVRRLTPRECERLQGFSDDYTLVPYRGKPMMDGPRYKALGNSWPVPVVRWIGRRIQSEMERTA